MRGIFGLVGLVVVLAIVGLLVKKQLTATRVPAAPSVQSTAPADTVRAQSQQVQEQVRQQMEGLMQQARPELEEAGK